MEKRKWLWKKKPSERGNGESESSGSISSHSERFSDDQEAMKATPNDDSSQSPEVTSKTSAADEEVNETIKCLTEKLSAALVNVSQKDDLVKQHSKVAEEAVAGWENAENDLEVIKVQLEAATHKKSQLEDRVSHLDGALKECVRQLRQARDEQEAKIHEAVANKSKEWESVKSELEKQILHLKTEAEATKRAESPPRVDPDLFDKLEYLEQENESLRHELLSQSEELEVRTIERDLSTQAAESASRQHLESIRKLAKLEAECRRLKTVACRVSSPRYDYKTSAASSVYLESLTTDSHSDSGGERLSALDLDTRKASNLDTSALFAELDQFKNGKAANTKNLPASAVEIDLMDDFLEMERLASMAETESRNNHVAVVKQSTDAESALRVELETAIQRSAELEIKLNELQEVKSDLEHSLESTKAEKAEVESSLVRMMEEKAQVERSLQEMMAEKSKMETSLTRSQDENKATERLMREVQLKLEEVESELSSARESKQEVESQLIGLEAECRTMSAQVATLETELEKERATSAEFSIKYLYLEEELSKKKEKSMKLNREPKIKQEDIALAAGKLAECQKTILSLGKQLKSLATLEDFLMDTSSIPEISAGASSSSAAASVSNGEELWSGLHSSETYSPAIGSSSSRAAVEGGVSHPSPSKYDHQSSPPSASSSTSSAVVSSLHTSSDKNRNGFAKFFSRSKNGIQLEL